MAPSSQVQISEGSRNLQESLHVLLSRLAATMEHVKNWPEAKGDDASIHVETTSKLIAHIQDVVESLKKVEGVVKADTVLRKSLQQCLIPYDLLDLLNSNLNPDCFCRGLLREALGQLAGLKRRKLALGMLGAAVQAGINKKSQHESVKRQRSDVSSSEQSESLKPPPSKRARVQDSKTEAR